MTETLLILVLAYLVVALLLILALLYSRWKAGPKLLLVLLSGLLFWASYEGWKQSQGWPTSTALPDKFLLHYSVIEEPDDVAGTEGGIYIWATDLANNQLADVPRAYHQPYSQELHAKVESAMRRAKAGNLQLGLKRSTEDLPEVKRFRMELGDKPIELEFVPVPDPALPEK